MSFTYFWLYNFTPYRSVWYETSNGSKAEISRNTAVQWGCASDLAAVFMHECDSESLQCVSKFCLSTPLKPTYTLRQGDFIFLLHSAVSVLGHSRMIDRPRSWTGRIKPINHLKLRDKKKKKLRKKKNLGSKFNWEHQGENWGEEI